MLATLPPDDAYRARSTRQPALIARMIAEGYTGRKGKGGFYRAEQARRRPERQGSDRPRRPASTAPASKAAARQPSPRPRAACARWSSIPTRAAATPARVLVETLAYAAAWCRRSPTTSPTSMQAMRLGYNWKYGPVRADRPARRRLAGRGARRPRAGRCRRCWRRRPGRPLLPRRGRQAAVPGHRRRLPRRGRGRTACCCSPTSSAPRKPLAQERLGRALGHRRRRRLPRVHTQDERPRRRRAWR